MKKKFVVHFVLVLAAFISRAFTEEDFLISAMNGSTQAGPLVAYSSTDNQYLVVWTDDRTLADTGFDVYGQLFDSEGKAVDEEFPIITASGDQFVSAVAYDSLDNMYLVIWQDQQSQPSPNSVIRGQLVEYDGSLIGDDFLISDERGTSPVVAYNSRDNYYLVVWSGGQGGVRIYGQIIGPDGCRMSDNFPISTPRRNQNQNFPTVTYNSRDNQFFVAWWDNRNRSSHYTRAASLFAQRVGNDGRLISGEFNIDAGFFGVPSPAVTYNSRDNQYLLLYGGRAVLYASDGRRIASESTGAWYTPTVAYNDGDNQYLLVWADNRDRALRGTKVFGQWLDRNGHMVGENFKISVAPDDQYSPTVAYNSLDNQYLVVWTDWRNRATNLSDIYGQRVNPDGRFAGANFPVTREPYPGPRPAPGRPTRPSVAYNGQDDQYLVVWDDGRQARIGQNDRMIYGQILGSDGKQISDNFPVSSGPTQWNPSPAVAYNSRKKQYLVIWLDRYVRGRVIAADGRLLSDEFLISAVDPRGYYYSPALAYNSVNNQYLVVWSYSRQTADGELVSIFGRAVEADGRLVSGPFPISIDPRGRHGGPAVAYNSNTNQYLVAWLDGRTKYIYGQLVGSDGRVGSLFQISSPTPEGELVDPGTSPTIAYNGKDNQYLVVWSNWRDQRTYGQFVGPDGRLVSNNFSISATGGGTPTLVYNSMDNEYLVTWIGATDLPQGIRGQRVGSDGRLIAGRFTISTRPTGLLAIAHGSQVNQYLIVWEDGRADASIYGMLIELSGPVANDPPDRPRVNGGT